MNNFITKTTIANVKKYLNDKGIKVNYSDEEKLFELAKLIRNNEKIELMRKEKQLKGIEQLEISAILKTEYFDERYFFTEGIQEVDYSVWDYADTEIIFTGKNYFEYFTSFVDVIGSKIVLHLKNKSIKHITKSELIEIFDFYDLFIFDEDKNITKKKAIKVFLIDSVFKKQKYEEIKEKEQKENNIYEFLNDLKNRNYICNNENYNDKKGLSGYFLFLDYQNFCTKNKTKPEEKKIFIKECKNNFKWICKSKRISTGFVKDTCFFVF